LFNGKVICIFLRIACQAYTLRKKKAKRAGKEKMR
jgi:hypothetical protein